MILNENMKHKHGTASQEWKRLSGSIDKNSKDDFHSHTFSNRYSEKEYKYQTCALHGYTFKHNRHERMQLFSERENIDCFNAKDTKFNGT